ncbi:methyltransferase domain-containing protein [Ferroplasma sp.]|uniref:class I SAM-dependent methyltransferase n=1 Tax=Ferroplasma sp. TaxID=2591003 RepID=UPI00307F0C36
MDDYERTKDFFSRNSENYANSISHAEDDDLNILIAMLSLNNDMIGLDEATGAGFTAIKLAKIIREVYALDMVENMLSETEKLAKANNLKNVIPVKGYIDSLPFEDKKFDVVTCRRAPHHFVDLNKFAIEAYRVLKENGMIGIDDMTVPRNIVDDFNELEKIRDNSHVHAASVEEWSKILSNAGFINIKYKIYRKKVAFKQWIYPVNEESQEAKRALDYLNSARKEFISGIEWNGKSFQKSWMVITGIKNEK